MCIRDSPIGRHLLGRQGVTIVALAIESTYGLLGKSPLPLTGQIYDHGSMSLVPPSTNTPTCHFRGLTPEVTGWRGQASRCCAIAPGIFAAVTLAIAARQLASLGTFSSLTIAVVAGIILGNVPLGALEVHIDRLRPGLAFAGKHILRLGVVALGMRLSVGQVGDLGLPVIATIIATVAATFFGTQALGRRLGVSRPLSLLCLLYTSPSPRDRTRSRMPSSA